MRRDSLIGLAVALGCHALVLFGIPPPFQPLTRPSEDSRYVEVSLVGPASGPAVAAAPQPAAVTAAPPRPLPPEPAPKPAEPEFQRPERMRERPRKVARRPKNPPPATQPPAGRSANSADTASEAASPGGSLASAGTGAADTALPQLAAEFLEQVRPKYPSEAKRLRQEGRVLVSIYVSISGKIDKVEISESSGFPLLDEAAVAAARRSRLRPAYIGNRPMNSKVEAPYRFVLKDG